MENQEVSYQEPINHQNNEPFWQHPLPNTNTVLALGIISILTSFCFGIGLISGIIALVLAKKDTILYLNNPSMYSQTSYNNIKVGKICGIIGTCMSALYFIVFVIYIAFIATFLTSIPWNTVGRH